MKKVFLSITLLTSGLFFVIAQTTNPEKDSLLQKKNKISEEVKKTTANVQDSQIDISKNNQESVTKKDSATKEKSIEELKKENQQTKEK